MTDRKQNPEIQLHHFRERVTDARRRAGYFQKELAAALGLDTGTLSRKLHGTSHMYLTHMEVKLIIKSLTLWDAITTRVEAIELLHLMGLKPESFSEEEWQSEPLSQLEQTDLPLHTASERRVTPVQSLRPEPAALPIPTTSLIGRESLLNDLRGLFQREVRLVTFVGTGGVGKTRLGLQVTQTLLNEFPDGIFFVSLSSLQDPTLLPSTIAEALGLLGTSPEIMLINPIQTIEQKLLHFLRNRRILLFLDNFEHLLEAARFVGELLAATLSVKVLVTSRAILHLYGEHIVRVPPLEFPDPACIVDNVSLDESPAIRLFVERARAVLPDFALTRDNCVTVVRLCACLDGLPLAIELAAARSYLYPPHVLLAHLREVDQLNDAPRLSLLQHPSQNTHPRQHTLQATLTWSYELLTTTEQTLLRHVAVFLGGWTIEAAYAICLNVARQDELLALLESLVNQSMITLISRKRVHASERGLPRFALLETVREYALWHLKERKEVEQIQGLHASYYLCLAESAKSELLGDTPEGHHRAIEQFEQEQGNIRAAFHWVIEQEEGEQAARFCHALAHFWIIRNQFGEAESFIDATLSLREVSSSHLMVKLLRTKAHISLLQGDYERARDLLEMSLKQVQQREKWREEANILSHIGDSWFLQGTYTEASRAYEKCLHLYHEHEEWSAYGLVLGRLGAIATFQKQFAEAKSLLQQSASLLRERGRRIDLYTTLGSLGVLEAVLGNQAQACDAIREGLLIAQEIGEQVNIAVMLIACGCLLTENKQGVLAITLWGTAETVFEQIGASFPIVYRPLYTFYQMKAKAQVETEEAWMRWWTQGKDLSLQQAILLALKNI
jgi:predicted ATPase